MIILDTHVWVWHVQGDPDLTPAHQAFIQAEETNGLGISAISLWEVAKLVELKRLSLPVPTEDWLALALSYPGIILLPLTPRVVVESTSLPGHFRRSDHRSYSASS
jgi:PIN domain nuclease of toxin-antitoxin system